MHGMNVKIKIKKIKKKGIPGLLLPEYRG